MARVGKVLTITPATALLSPPRATEAQCRAFILARPHGEYTEGDVKKIVAAYFEKSAGIDPLLAIAQMIHETGCLTSWWSQRPRRNAAGVGVTGRKSPVEPAKGTWQPQGDTWVEGVAFETWRDDAVPSHLGRLLAYALHDCDANTAQLELIARAMSDRALPRTFRGCAPTLQGLNGKWAVPGKDYDDRISATANAILGAS